MQIIYIKKKKTTYSRDSRRNMTLREAVFYIDIYGKRDTFSLEKKKLAMHVLLNLSTRTYSLTCASKIALEGRTFDEYNGTLNLFIFSDHERELMRHLSII